MSKRKDRAEKPWAGNNVMVLEARITELERALRELSRGDGGCTSDVSDDVVCELVNRLERHKAAAAGISDLKIGWETIISDFTDCIRLLLHLRRILIETTNLPTYRNPNDRDGE